MAVGYCPRIVTEGMVLCLDAANRESYPGSGAIWSSLGTQASGANLINGPTFSSTNGGGIVFDGVNDKGTFTSPIVSSSSQSYEIWAKAKSSNIATDGYSYLLHNNNANNAIGTSYMTIGYSNTNVIFGCLNGVFGNMLTGVIGNTTTIRQIVLTWNGATQIVYVDGIQRNSAALTTTPQNFSTVTSFGDDKNTTYRMIQGSIYSIKAYNRALTSAEILQNYNALKGRFAI